MQEYIVTNWHYISDYVSGNSLVLALFAFVVIVASQIIPWLTTRLLKRLHKQAENTANIWDNVIYEAAMRPLSLFIKASGALLAILIITIEIDNEIFEGIISNTFVIFIPIFSWFLSNLVRSYEKNYLELAQKKDKQPDITTVQAISKLVRLSIIIITILLIMQNLGVNVTGLVAAGGVSGIAIGFAAQDLLANFFGGLMLYLEKPFKVGDWIRSPDREIEGTVTAIGLRTTAIMTFDHRPIYVPNSIFTKIVIENPSRMSNRRIYETIGVRYDDFSKVEKILVDIRKHLIENQDIDTSMTTMVNFNAFSDSSLDCMIYCFTYTKKWQEYHEIKEKLLLEIGKIIEYHGAQIAYPTSTVHLQTNTESPIPMEPTISGKLRSGKLR